MANFIFEGKTAAVVKSTEHALSQIHEFVSIQSAQLIYPLT